MNAVKLNLLGRKKLFRNNHYLLSLRIALQNQLGKMSTHESYLNLQKQMSRKHCHPAAERNKDPILQSLKKYIDDSKENFFLEVSSGSGQHVAHFAPHFPNTTFQPTEYEKSSIQSINAYVAENTSGNIKNAQFLDVREHPSSWLGGTLKSDTVDYMMNINMMHISEWACSEGLFTGAGILLKPEGLLFTYGPYAFDGKISPESNISFDSSLRSRDPSWGLRDVVRELQPLAKKHGIQLEQKHDLPANNHFLVWRKTKTS